MGDQEGLLSGGDICDLLEVYQKWSKKKGMGEQGPVSPGQWYR